MGQGSLPETTIAAIALYVAVRVLLALAAIFAAVAAIVWVYS